MIIIASTSPTRQSLLSGAGLTFTAEPPRVDERDLIARHPNWSPEEVPQKLAEAKATEVSLRHPAALVIGADQVLALGNKVYGKPSSIEQCRQHLLELRGKAHALISSVACARAGKTQWSHTAIAKLKVRPFSESFLNSYLAQVGDDCMSTVAGYKIESLGIQLFEHIEGDHFTILGLPLLPLLEYLRSAKEIPS